MQLLRNQIMSPGTPSMSLLPFSMNFTSPTGSSSSGIQKRYQMWAEERFVSFNTVDSLVFVLCLFSYFISGVIVNVGSSHGRVKPKTIKLVFDASPLLACRSKRLAGSESVYYVRVKATYLPTDCCFSELAL